MKNLFDDQSTRGHRRSWGTGFSTPVALASSVELWTVRDQAGTVACNCPDWKRADGRLRWGNAVAPATCAHVFEYVKRGEDQSFIWISTCEIDGEALPLDPVVYWKGRGLVPSVAAAINVTVRRDRLEVFAPPNGDFVGYAPLNSGRAHLRAMVAPVFIAYAIDEPCTNCGERAAWSDKEDERFAVLHRGVWMIQHHNQCPSCSDDDLVPKP